MIGVNVEIWRQHYHGPAIPVSRSLSIRHWLVNLLGISLQCLQICHTKMADLQGTPLVLQSRAEPVVQATGSSYLLDERALDVRLSLPF